MPRIPRAIIDELIAHARADAPNECCGMVHAQDGTPVAVHRVTNAAASPYRYMMEPREQYRLEMQRDATGETLFAIYHSHVASEAWPSPTDVRQAFFPPGEIEREPAYPDTYYILVSLAVLPGEPAESLPASGEGPVRAFRIHTGGVIEEEPIEVG